ncbi:hypothetical protein Ahy_B08g093031 [Arachis hypogaea]|uniref:SWIM-type domain-containing protein n=1 Tax=Arachis hypogaea TaxID=3818 RepID=A0A444Y573_ARAHY|nr:hypothetical protein Ahy_B08g093031 [Arachis hypogaea]
MDDSTSDCQLNQGEVDYKFESNEVPESLSVVDDQFVLKVGMTFTTLENAGKFYRNYAKAAGFSTRVRSTNRKGNEIKNQLITCSKEEKWKSKISLTEKMNPTAGLNCPARIYIHTLKDVGAWIISKVVLDHSHPCCPSKAEMLKQHRELSISIRRTIENNEEAEACMPTTIHRWCIWKIIKKIPSKLNGYKGHAEIEQEMSQVVWNSHSKDSFDRNWNDFLLNFGLVDNKWLSVYKVGEQVSSSIFNKFVVTYDSVAAEVKCQCLLFESKGILCLHALSVLSFERVSQVSPRYILERWSKKSSHDEPLLEPRSKRFDQLVFHSQNICEFASELEELTAILHHAYDNIMVEMESLKAKRKGTSFLSHEDANLESVNELQSPPRIRTRGRPKNRLGSKLDKQIANATKKKKMKALNELNLFDAVSVVHSNSSQYEARVMNYQFRVPAAANNSLGV